MKLTIIYGLAVLFFLAACAQKNEKSYPDADAVYLKKAKTYRLNPDGSITTTEEKQQKLLTYRAFQSLYGETHVLYDPQVQTVNIKSAFTVMANGKKVQVPENGINDILPYWSAGSKAYNHLRDKVITHTGLERNATINTEWSVTANKDICPFLAGVETISADCPIESYEVKVEVPENTKLNYKLLNSDVQPRASLKNGIKTYTWQFTGLTQNVPESNTNNTAPTVPVLLFSTQNDEASVLKWLAQSGNNPEEIPENAVARLNKDVKTLNPVQKILKAQEIVAGEVNTLFIPATLTGFKSRSPREVWQSNSGTPFEKCGLLAAIIRSLGNEAEVCIKYPAFANETALPFYLLAEPLVKAVADKDTLYLSPTRTNKNASEFRATGTVIRSIGSGFKKVNVSQPALAVKLNSELALNSNAEIKGNLQAEYSNAAVPWYALLADQTKTPDKQLNTKAKVEELSETKLVVSSAIDSKSWAAKRGNYIFVSLPESHEASETLIPKVLFSDRINSFLLPCPINETYHFRLQLPKNYQLTNPVKEEITNAVGSVQLIFSQEADKVTIDKQLKINKQEIKPEEYTQFKQLLDKWHTPKFKELVVATK